jgi:beta-lactamase superfamily II metal-dependent hydrolase
MIRRLGIPVVLPLFVLSQVAVWPGAVRAVELPPAGHFRLWQLPTQELVPWDHSLGMYACMAYVIQGPTGHVAVIDGGNVCDGPELKRFLRGLGGRVDEWFISHQHPDHIGAVIAVLNDQAEDKIEIGRIYGSFLSDTYIERISPDPGPGTTLQISRDLNAALAASGRSVLQPALGQEITMDGMEFQILLLADEGNTAITDINDQCMLVRLTTPGTSVLFLGDLHTMGGPRLLASKFADALPSEYVQMAHHGNWGVGRAVYAAVKARYALWPTPAFLWNAPMPNNPDDLDCAKVRQWMVELGIEKNYVMKDGPIRLDLPMDTPDRTSQ